MLSKNHLSFLVLFVVILFLLLVPLTIATLNKPVHLKTQAAQVIPLQFDAVLEEEDLRK